MKDILFWLLFGAFFIVSITLMIMVGTKEPVIVPVVNKCPVVECPVTSEPDCAAEVLDTLKEANVLKQTLKRAIE